VECSETVCCDLTFGLENRRNSVKLFDDNYLPFTVLFVFYYIASEYLKCLDFSSSIIFGFVNDPRVKQQIVSARTMNIHYPDLLHYNQWVGGVEFGFGGIHISHAGEGQGHACKGLG